MKVRTAVNEVQKHIIDLTPLFLGDRQEKDFSFEFTPEVFDDSIVIESPVICHGRVYEKANARSGAQNYIELGIKLEGSYKTGCARCLADMTVPVRIEADYCVVNKPKNDEDNDSILFAPEGKLDVGEVADALFFLNLPSKHICREDCKGLCQKCGKNFNEGKCQCEEKNIDPRLAVLKKLLDKTEN